MLDAITEWNIDTKRDKKIYDEEDKDEKMCHSLLYSLVSKENLRENNINNHVVDFIKGLVFLSIHIKYYSSILIGIFSFQ